jgi:hypothetical protein
MARWYCIEAGSFEAPKLATAKSTKLRSLRQLDAEDLFEFRTCFPTSRNQVKPNEPSQILPLSGPLPLSSHCARCTLCWAVHYPSDQMIRMAKTIGERWRHLVVCERRSDRHKTEPRQTNRPRPNRASAPRPGLRGISPSISAVETGLLGSQTCSAARCSPARGWKCRSRGLL